MALWTLPFPVVKCMWKAVFCSSNVSPVSLIQGLLTVITQWKHEGWYWWQMSKYLNCIAYFFIYKEGSWCYSVCAFFSLNHYTVFWWVFQNTGKRSSLVSKCQVHLMRVYIPTASVLRLFHYYVVSTAVWNLTVTAYYWTHNCNIITVFIMFMFHITKLMSNIDMTKNSITHTFF